MLTEGPRSTPHRERSCEALAQSLTSCKVLVEGELPGPCRLNITAISADSSASLQEGALGRRTEGVAGIATVELGLVDDGGVTGARAGATAAVLQALLFLKLLACP